MIRQPRLAATSSPASGAIWAEKRSITIRSSRRYGLDYECGMRNAECGMSGQASMTDAYICAALRTPVGKHGGSLASVRADDLAAIPIKAVVERTGVDPLTIDDVILGCTNQAGEDNRNVARMALLLAGLPVEVPGQTVNLLCGSGLQAVASAAQAIKAGEGEGFIAGGVESMTRAPDVMLKPGGAWSRTAPEIADTTGGGRFTNPRLQKERTSSLGEAAGDGGQFERDQRRGRRVTADGERRGRTGDVDTAGTGDRYGGGGRGSELYGARADPGDPESPEARRTVDRSNRSGGAERSVRRPGDRLYPRAQARSRARQHLRRRDRARPPAGRHRRSHPDDSGSRPTPNEVALRFSDYVHRGRPGHRPDRGAELNGRLRPCDGGDRRRDRDGDAEPAREVERVRCGAVPGAARGTAHAGGQRRRARDRPHRRGPGVLCRCRPERARDGRPLRGRCRKGSDADHPLRATAGVGGRERARGGRRGESGARLRLPHRLRSSVDRTGASQAGARARLGRELLPAAAPSYLPGAPGRGGGRAGSRWPGG